MDSFDEIIKNKINNEKWVIPENIDKSMDNTLKNLESKKLKKRISLKVLVASFIIMTLSFTTVLANTPQGKEFIRSTIEFFNGGADSKYFSSKDSFEKFNNSIGSMVKDNGIKLTINNIAIDDNFLNIFYTIESDKPISKIEEETLWSPMFTAPNFQYKIDEKYLDTGNNNDVDAYFESDKILKGMIRENISQINIPQKFNLEVYTSEIFGEKGQWNISTNVDKAHIEEDTLSVKPNKNVIFNVNGIKNDVIIEKVSISPFSNQIVLSENIDNDGMFCRFALFDDNGNHLDDISSSIRGMSNGKAINSFEFVNENKDMKYITLIPIEEKEKTEEIVIEESKANINELPCKLNTGEQGNIVVEEVKIEKNIIKVTYKKQGIVLIKPSIFFYDCNGERINDDYDGCMTPYVDRTNGTYTEIMSFHDKDIDLSKIKGIGVYNNENFKLLRDQEVRIDFK